MVELAARFARDENGATAIEYGLIAGLVCVGLITVLSTFGTKLLDLMTATFNKVAAGA